MSKTRTILFQLATVGGVGVVALVTLECGVRLLEPPNDAAAFRQIHEARPDRDWLYGLKPEAEVTLSDGVRYRINSEGFRDRERHPTRDEEMLRIAAVGDSVTFGWRVPLADAWPARVEQELAVAADSDVEVLNFGVGGYNPYTEAALVRDIVVGYRPDWIVVQFCINDLDDPTWHFDPHTRKVLRPFPAAVFPDPSMVGRSEGPPSKLGNLCARSKLCGRFAALRRRWGGAPQAVGASSDGGDPRGRDAVWEWVERHYVEMADAADSVGARFAVTFLPYVPERGQVADAWVFDRLRAMAEARSWLVADPRPALEHAAAAGPLFLDAWHPDSRGHAVAAEAIAEALLGGDVLSDVVWGAGTPELEAALPVE